MTACNVVTTRAEPNTKLNNTELPKDELPYPSKYKELIDGQSMLAQFNDQLE